ncbi:response regulator [Myxococcota bacterium]|nr:response regulator [Myxococcota bacterium]MBU1428945.1 response regulator [Myxococcota bacterium]MBU1898237.1 response regulator [Myxococcota bacterium]
MKPRDDEEHASKPRILIVEDHDMGRALLCRQLSHLGYAFEAVEDGRRALQAAQRAPFSLILTDLNMPEIGGQALAALIRAGQPGVDPQIPILLLTADAHLTPHARALFSEILIKPCPLPRLDMRLRHWIGLAPGRLTPQPLPRFDVARLRALIGGDEAMTWQLLKGFVESAEEAKAGLGAAMEAQDAAAAAALAHQLKSAARVVGADALEAACAALQHAAAPQDELQSLGMTLLEALELVIEQINARLEARFA